MLNRISGLLFFGPYDDSSESGVSQSIHLAGSSSKPRIIDVQKTPSSEEFSTTSDTYKKSQNVSNSGTEGHKNVVPISKEDDILNSKRKEADNTVLKQKRYFLNSLPQLSKFELSPDTTDWIYSPKRPPRWALVQHTLSTLWYVSNGRQDLVSETQLLWARNYLRLIIESSGGPNNFTQPCLDKIEDSLISKYAEISTSAKDVLKSVGQIPQSRLSGTYPLFRESFPVPVTPSCNKNEGNCSLYVTVSPPGEEMQNVNSLFSVYQNISNLTENLKGWSTIQENNLEREKSKLQELDILISDLNKSTSNLGQQFVKASSQAISPKQASAHSSIDRNSGIKNGIESYCTSCVLPSTSKRLASPSELNPSLQNLNQSTSTAFPDASTKRSSRGLLKNSCNYSSALPVIPAQSDLQKHSVLPAIPAQSHLQKQSDHVEISAGTLQDLYQSVKKIGSFFKLWGSSQEEYLERERTKFYEVKAIFDQLKHSSVTPSEDSQRTKSETDKGNNDIGQDLAKSMKNLGELFEVWSASQEERLERERDRIVHLNVHFNNLTHALENVKQI